MSYSNSGSLEKNNIILEFLKGLIVAMMLSFGLVLAFAFSLKWWEVSDNMILPINLAIKLVSVCAGAAVAVKGDKKGLVKGLAFGLVYMTFAFVCFSILAQTFELDLSFVLDLVCSAVAGGIVGIIKVNKK